MSRTKKRIVQKLLCLCLVISLLTGTTAFAKSNGYKWKDTPVIYFDKSVLGGMDQSRINCIQRAMSTWNSVTYNGDPMITLNFKSSVPNTIREKYVIADWVGYSYIYPIYESPPPNTVINHVDIELNVYHSLTDGASSGSYDVQSVIQHELGHALGIAHCHENGETPCSSTCYKNTMHWQSVPNSVEKRYLKTYDTSSKFSIYL